MRFAKAAFVAALLAVSASALPGFSADTAVTVEQPWARPNLPDRPTAAYMVVTSIADVGDRLLDAESPAFGAVEIHSVTARGDVMAMQQVDAVDLPAGGTVIFAPGGFHLMLFDATRRFAEGESFPLTLVFEKAGRITVEVPVRKRAPEVTGHGHGAGQMGRSHAH